MTKLNVKNLDHLGIIAAIVDELGLVDYINEQLQENDRAKISAGLVVKAMILNGLGFINSPLYLFSPSSAEICVHEKGGDDDR